MPSIFTLQGIQFGAAGMCAVKSAGVRQVAGVAFQVPDTQGPMVACDGWIGRRPPSDAEIAQIQKCSNMWPRIGAGGGQLADMNAGACGKSNFSVPSDFKNFYRDSKIEKLFSPRTGEVLVVPNNPTWIKRGLDWVLDNCSYLAIGAGVANPAIGAAALAACQLTSSGAPPPAATDPGGASIGPGFTPTKRMATTTKVAIGVGAAAVVGGGILALLHFSRR